MKLSGIEIANFRSIGQEPVVLSPLRKCNILIGQNNVGKSNVIKGVQHALHLLRARYGTPQVMEEAAKQPLYLGTYDLHKEQNTNRFSFKLIFEGDANQDRELMNSAGTKIFAFEFGFQNNNLIFVDNNFARINTPGLAVQTYEFFTGERVIQEMGRRWDSQRTRELFLTRIELIF